MSPEDIISKAGLLDADGHWAEAVALLRGLLDDPAQEDEEDADWLRTVAYLHMGNALTTANDQEGAVAAYETCISLAIADPEDPDQDNLAAAYFNMGAAFEKWNRLDDAFSCYRVARRIAPSDSTREALVRTRLRLMKEKTK